MQFVSNGPDVPEPLLQAHEEGRVIFFCGAGISYPADLPSFRGLVQSVYKELGTPKTEIEGAAFDKDQFDATLDLLDSEAETSPQGSDGNSCRVVTAGAHA